MINLNWKEGVKPSIYALAFGCAYILSSDLITLILERFFSLEEHCTIAITTGEMERTLVSSVRRSFHIRTLPIMYTTVILFSGFMIFSLSSFEGAQVMGLMTNAALIVAMITDLFLLPILLLWEAKEKEE